MPQSPAYEPAYLGRRLAAMLYDGLLLLAMWIVTCLIWFPLYGAAVSGPLLTGVLTAETLAFYAYCWRRTGETLGMRAWRLRVVNTEGISPSGNKSRYDCSPLSLLSVVSALVTYGFISVKPAKPGTTSQATLTLYIYRAEAGSRPVKGLWQFSKSTKLRALRATSHTHTG